MRSGQQDNGPIGKSIQKKDNLYIYCMKDTSAHDQRIADMAFASVYPHYVTKPKWNEKAGQLKNYVK